MVLPRLTKTIRKCSPDLLKYLTEMLFHYFYVVDVIDKSQENKLYFLLILNWTNLILCYYTELTISTRYCLTIHIIKLTSYSTSCDLINQILSVVHGGYCDVIVMIIILWRIFNLMKQSRSIVAVLAKIIKMPRKWRWFCVIEIIVKTSK